jgi:hypothetical protein
MVRDQTGNARPWECNFVQIWAKSGSGLAAKQLAAGEWVDDLVRLEFLAS